MAPIQFKVGALSVVMLVVFVWERRALPKTITL